jgi:NitT/TauT family transport system substrate-binding protein
MVHVASAPIGRRKAIATLAGAAVATALPRRAKAAATVKFGSVGGLSDAGLYLADEYGYFAASGITLDMQQLDSAPTLVQLIATSQIDVAGISLTPGLFASVPLHIGLAIVGDKQSYRHGFSGMRLIARPPLVLADERATIAGLKGKNIAISAKGSVSYYLLDRVLSSVKLSLSDVGIIELAYGSMYPAFTTGAIDAAISIEPFLTKTLSQGAAKQISDLIEFAPGRSMTNVPLVYSETMIKNSSLAQDFMTAYVKGVRIYNDAFVKGKDKGKVIAIIARRARLSEDIVRDSFPFGLDPDQHVNTAVLDDVQRFFVREGMLKAVVSLNQVVDLSFAERAVASLGTYRA